MFELVKFDQVGLSASISLLFLLLLLILVKTHLFQVVKSESDIDTKCQFLSFNITSIGRKSDIDTKYLQSFCINFTPPPPSPCPLHPPCSPEYLLDYDVRRVISLKKVNDELPPVQDCV